MDYPGKVITKNQVTPSQTSASGVWTVDDAAAAVENNSWPVAGVPNPISRSLRFNSADSAYLNRTPATAGNQKTWTWSGWVKLSSTSNGYIFGVVDSDDSDTAAIAYTGNQFSFQGYTVNYRDTTALYRDFSAWYHLVVVLDTTQATANNRVKMYVNGVEVTSFATLNNPSQNADLGINTATAHSIGRRAPFGGGGVYFNGYLTEINFIDGQALDATYFGMTDPVTGAWIPKAYNGTYGTNGFYLNFSNNSSTAALGTDYSGNSNTWTTNNFSVTAGAGNDSLTDVPTPWIAYNTTGDVGGVVRGNYATLNPLWKGANITLANGNLDASATSLGSSQAAISSIFVSSGKWYFEYLQNEDTNSNLCVGIADQSFNATNTYVGSTATTYGYIAKNNNKWNNGSFSSYGSGSASNGDVLMCAFDLDNGKIYFGKNGTWYGSGDPVAGTDAAFTGISGTYCPAYSHNSGSSQSTGASFNFGQRPFAYTPPAGFLSLCTTNLPTPTILDGGDYFNAVLYTGNGSTQSITGVGFAPDWVWLKYRNSADNHALFDSVRGASGSNYYRLESNTTGAETLTGTAIVSSLDTDGFTLGANTQGNQSGGSYVAWNWKAGGTPAVTNTDGTITSSISVNTTSGFSIVTYTGTGSAGATVGHGLDVAPSMIIIKNRTDSASAFWCVYHRSAYVSGADPNVLYLNTTDAQADDTNVWGASPDFNSSTFELGDYNGSNGSGDSLVAYCFAAVPGFSAFGSYTGNGSADGPFVFTGVRARYILVKRTNDVGSWRVWDTARNTYNLTNLNLVPNDSQAEASSGNEIDILSNGFKLRSTSGDTNASGATYIYMAFAENPFKYSNAR
jgi:hypothetical protein